MIDETSQELLSRALDDDLDREAQAELEARLAAEPELRRRLETLRELRAAVARLAEDEQAPRALDVLVEPLRRSPVPRRAVRPAFAWLAAAASVVLAVTLGLELARRQPTPAITPAPTEQKAARRVPATPAATPGPRRYFQLAPLPQPRDRETTPQGAAERLLHEGPEEPRLEPPVPLEVVGPLDAPPAGKSEEPEVDRADRQAGERSAPTPSGRNEAAAPTRPQAGAAGLVPAPAAARSAVADGAEAPSGEDRLAGELRGVAAGRPAEEEGLPLRLTVDAGGIRYRLTVPDPDTPAENGVALALTVRALRIVAVAGRDPDRAPGEDLAAALRRLGPVRLQDGVYPAVARPIDHR